MTDVLDDYRSLRRGTSVVAAGALLAQAEHAVAGSSGESVGVTLVLATGAAGCLALAVAAMVLSEARLHRLDVSTLAVGMIIQLAQFGHVTSVTPTGPTDETVLNRLAMTSLLHNQNPYTIVYHGVGADGSGTPLFSGGQANTYAYPPLSLEIGRMMGLVDPRLAAPGVVGAVGLLALAVGAFFALPRHVRSLSIITVMGLGIETPSAYSGWTILLAVALLCLPLWRWTSTGAGGRLRVTGVCQAVSLGAACSAHQMAWFIGGFLTVALWLVRRGELGTGRALVVVSRYLGVAAGTFALINAPFIVANSSAWLRAMGATLTQRAIVGGTGWALPLIVANGGTSRIGLLSVAPVLALLAVVALYAVGFRKLAPALAVLPSLPFLVSTRTVSEYFLSPMPLWLVAAANMDRHAVAATQPLRISRGAGWVTASRAAKLALVLLAALPAGAVFVAGVTGSAPLRMRILHATLAGSRIANVTVEVTNELPTPVRPRYFIDLHTSITRRWTREAGAEWLRPSEDTVVVLRPRSTSESAVAGPSLWIFATTDSPAGVAARPLRLTPKEVSVLGPRHPTSVQTSQERCYATLLSGQGLPCDPG